MKTAKLDLNHALVYPAQTRFARQVFALAVSIEVAEPDLIYENHVKGATLRK